MKKMLYVAVAVIGACWMCEGMIGGTALPASGFDRSTRELGSSRRSDFVDVRSQVSQHTDISLSDSGHFSAKIDSLSSSSDESASTAEPVLLSSSLSSPELYPLHTPHSSPTTSRSKSLSPPSAEPSSYGEIIRSTPVHHSMSSKESSLSTGARTGTLAALEKIYAPEQRSVSQELWHISCSLGAIKSEDPCLSYLFFEKIEQLLSMMTKDMYKNIISNPEFKYILGLMAFYIPYIPEDLFTARLKSFYSTYVRGGFSKTVARQLINEAHKEGSENAYWFLQGDNGK